MSNNTRLAELMNYITVDTTSGTQLQVSGSIKQTAVTSAILKTSATGVVSAATAGTDYLTSVGISNLTATGTPSATTYLRGDNTWATVSGGGSGVTLDTVQTITGAKTFQAATNFTNTSTMDTVVNWGANQLTSSGWGTLPANWSGSFDTAYTITAGGGTLTNTLALPIYSYFRATITATVTTTGTFDIYCGGTSGDAYWSSVSMPVGTFTSSKFAFTTTTGTTSLVASSTLVATISNIKIELLSGSNLPNTTYNSSSGNNKIELTVDNISASNNINIGLDTGKKNYSGINNVAIGASTLMENLTGSTNIAIGLNSLKFNKIGFSNTAVGAYALQNNINANLNVGVGAQALISVTTGSWNTAVGSYALAAITGSTENVAVGESALRYMTSGSKNVAVGDYAGGYHITGNNNVFLGASINYTTNPTNSNDSIIIGTQSKSLASGQSNQIVIGFNTTGLGSNTTVLGNSSTTLTALYGAVITGGTSINAAAQLQIDSTTKGVLFPRMTTTQKNAIATPPAGLVVYDTDLAKLCVRTASAWETITSA